MKTEKQNFNKSLKLAFFFILIFAALVYLVLNLLVEYNDIKQLPDSFLRFFRTMYTCAMIMFDYKWSLLGMDSDSDIYKQEIKIIHKRSAERVLELCKTNQGLYIKAGQYLATFNHILPPEYTKTLSVLQDKAPYKSFDMVERIFEEDFGFPPSHYFKEFDTTPIAAASLAQVHHAVTHSGRNVAVKVQYNQLQGQFKGDMMAHDIVLQLVSKAFKGFDFTKVAGDDMKALLRNELDFINESKNIERAGKNITIPRVTVPSVLPEITSKRVLTMEWIDGCKINDIEKIKEMGFSLRSVVATMFDAFAEQIFITGFIHSDPHPGNVFVRKHNDGGYEVVLLDHGLYQTLKEHDRIYYAHLWKNLIEMNFKKIKFYTRKLGVNEDDYLLFSNMILMRSLNANTQIGLGSDMSEFDLKEMHDLVRNKMGEMMNILQAMPKEFMLVLRNHNILRSINHELGVPVNRFAIWGRMAVRAISEQEKKVDGDATFVMKLKAKTRSLYEKYRFEFKLNLFEFRYWIIEQLFQLMPNYFMRKFLEVKVHTKANIKAA